MLRISSISMKFDSHVGFSNGYAELTLKKPPPFVPSSLMTSCEATGPALERLDDALRDEHEADDDRDRQQDIDERPHEVA